MKSLPRSARAGWARSIAPRDTNLKRAVAIKVLPESVAADRDRLARFQREAEVLASLNHSNIAAIYGLERSDGVTALVMELVEGPTLADRIAHGSIPIDEALSIARQIAEALESAHEHGIIHRDLKPANIKLREDGTVKVLDFGLAKAMESTTSSTNMSLSPTITSPAMTQMGVILGTAAYMAPEQAKGKRVDERSDIWAFGCVLYEMLTGKRAFEGEDVSDTLAAVLRGAPDWSVLPSQLSPTFLVYLQRCLTRDPAQRVHDIADVRLALEGAFDVPVERVPATSPVEVRQAPWRLIAVGTAVIAAGAAVLGGLVTPILFPGRPPSVVRVTATPPNGVLHTPTDPDVAVSADGYRIAYATVRAGHDRALRTLPRPVRCHPNNRREHPARSLLFAGWTVDRVLRWSGSQAGGRKRWPPRERHSGEGTRPRRQLGSG